MVIIGSWKFNLASGGARDIGSNLGSMAGGKEETAWAYA